MFILKGIASVFVTLMLMLSTVTGTVGTVGTGHEDYKVYKNVIFMIGDGMGFNTIEATKALKGVDISMETMPVLSQSQTRSITNKVTDSAAGGTALACGTRTYNGAVGVYMFAPLANFWHVPKSLTDLAIEMGKSTGVLTTDQTSGATPAAFSAHSVARDFEWDISRDQMSSDIDLIWGCASETVTPEACAKNGFTYFSTATEMEALEAGTRSFGQFDWDAIANVTDENDTPYLADMTDKAIELLSDDEDGFFLMVEGAHIDKFSHSNDFNGSTAHTEEFSKAVQVALDFAAQDGDTLVVVTADHETGGITYNEETGEYYYTSGSHTGVNVPVFVSATDAGFVTGEAYKNCDVSLQVAKVMGCDDKEYPTFIADK